MKTNENKMYALTYCYEGVDDNQPYAVTLAVSTDKQKLLDEMEKCVDEDCEVDEDDDWADDKNFIAYRNCSDEITLQHKKNINLYATYKIHSVDCL